ncbi:MAG: S8/S53 family peptidase [Armatimonadota bacterium]
MNRKIFIALLVLIFIEVIMQIGRVYGQPEWGKKPESRLVAQNQEGLTEPAYRIEKYGIKSGEKPNLNKDKNGKILLEEWSDLRGFNLKRHKLYERFQIIDFSKLYSILVTCIFDSETPWPPKDKLPPNFDPSKIIEIGKEPGLGIKGLHNQGITGKGVKVAIIDQNLFQEHKEYKGKIAKYTPIGYTEEEIKNDIDKIASMHGPAVTSILVGNECGVAPGASLYYWAQNTRVLTQDDYTADTIKSIKQIIDYNKNKSISDKIRVISISSGCAYNDKNRGEWDRVKKEAKESGIIIISCSYEDDSLDGILCPVNKNRNNPNNYEMRYWNQFLLQDAVKKQNNRYLQLFDQTKQIHVPIENRTFASGFCGTNGYEFEGTGGQSWAPPYLAGVMALGLQIDPTLDEETIYMYLRETGTPFKKKLHGKEYDLGWIINPKGFVDRVKKELELKKVK